MPAAKYKYVEGSGVKTCSQCDETKPLDEFTKNKACSGGVTNQCKKCINVYQEKHRRIKYKDNPDFKARRQRSQDKCRAARYGLELHELDKMLADSGGLCEICGSPPSGKGTSGKSLHVDHCHATGVVRGILCSRCNITLGGVEDNTDLLAAMIQYLKTKGWLAQCSILH